LILTLHCHESEHLISRALDERLPTVERWALRLHFLSCWSCRRVRDQLALIHQAAQRRGQLAEMPPAAKAEVTLSEPVRQRISQLLRGEAERLDGESPDSRIKE
jgi:hypothetical protein